MMKIILGCIFLTFFLSLYAAPKPFILPSFLIARAPEKLRLELKKTTAGSTSYTRIAMEILEERIKLRMKLLKFDLKQNEALLGMDSSDFYKVQDIRISLTPTERKKIFSRYRDKIQLLTRYNKSFRIRNEVIELFRRCEPAKSENRFHSEFFSLLEFQHIYLEKQIQKLRITLR